jgi:hypothetical protein
MIETSPAKINQRFCSSQTQMALRTALWWFSMHFNRIFRVLPERDYGVIGRLLETDDGRHRWFS